MKLRRLATGRAARVASAVVAAALVATVLVAPRSSLRASLEGEFPAQLVRVETRIPAERDRLTDLGLDLTEHGGDDYVEAVLHNQADAGRLADAGFTWSVTIPDLAARAAENRRADAAYAEATATSPLPSGRETYRQLADYENEMVQLAARHPGHVRTFELSRRSLEGRPIRGVELSGDVHSTTDGKPTFLMMGLHHAREWPAGEQTIEFGIDLAKQYGRDRRITDLLDRARVVLVPVVNPDGFDQSRRWGELADLRAVDGGGTVSILATPGNAYKRKNCRTVDGRTPITGECEVLSPGGFGAGVDLNRNYGGLWGGTGASDVSAHPTYRGPAPFSEPETQAVRELVSSRHVTMLITNHTFGNLVLRPPGVRAQGVTVDEQAMRDLGALMTAQNGYRNIQGWQLYDTTGTTEDWSYNATGGYGYTFEIGPTEFHPPFARVVDEYVGTGARAGRGNREAFLLALESAADRRHHSVVAGEAPTGAVLRLKKSFATRTSLPDATGRPHVISDTLESTLVVGQGNRYTWHVNPSTRPEVTAHRLRVLAKAPSREETAVRSPVTWAPGGHVDVPFSMPEPGVAALVVALDWPTPDDLDLTVFSKSGDGSLTEVGSSENFLVAKERALVELPEPGEYVLRAANVASVTTQFTLTAGVYGTAGAERLGDDLIESYTLTCERRDGTVLQRATVTVDRGGAQRVDLTECSRRFPA